MEILCSLYLADMMLFFTLLFLACSLCVHSFHLKLQSFSNAPPIRNIRGERPRQQSRLDIDPHSACKIQTSTKLSSLIQHSADIKPSTTYWDLYGRVPHDDWLFTTSHLTKPDLLKRSFVEAVNQEIPIAIANFRRRMGIRSMFGTLTMIVPACLLLLYVSQRWHYSSNPLSSQFAREEAVRGFKSAIGALRRATGGDLTKKKGTVQSRDNGGRPNNYDDGEDEVSCDDDLDGDEIIDSV